MVKTPKWRKALEWVKTGATVFNLTKALHGLAHMLVSEFQGFL